MTIRPESAPVRAASGMKISNASRGRPNPYGGAGIRARAMPKGDRPIVLYPAYFDLGRTRGQGPRGAKRWAGGAPTAPEGNAAAKSPTPHPQSQEAKAFPSTPLRLDNRTDISTKDGLCGFNTSSTIRLTSVNGRPLRGDGIDGDVR